MKEHIFDLVGFAGIAMLATGLWIVSPALSLSVIGGLLLAFALMAGKARARANATQPHHPSEGKDG